MKPCGIQIIASTTRSSGVRWFAMRSFLNGYVKQIEKHVCVVTEQSTHQSCDESLSWMQSCTAADRLRGCAAWSAYVANFLWIALKTHSRQSGKPKFNKFYWKLWVQYAIIIVFNCKFIMLPAAIFKCTIHLSLFRCSCPAYRPVRKISNQTQFFTSPPWRNLFWFCMEQINLIGSLIAPWQFWVAPNQNRFHFESSVATRPVFEILYFVFVAQKWRYVLITQSKIWKEMQWEK